VWCVTALGRWAGNASLGRPGEDSRFALSPSRHPGGIWNSTRQSRSEIDELIGISGSRYLFQIEGGSRPHIPEKSSLPSAAFGAGAARFGLPSDSRGMPGVG